MRGKTLRKLNELMRAASVADNAMMANFTDETCDAATAARRFSNSHRLSEAWAYRKDENMTSKRHYTSAKLGEALAQIEERHEAGCRMAAQSLGWRWDEGGPHFYRNAPGASPFAPYEYQQMRTCDWQELCRREGIEFAGASS